MQLTDKVTSVADLVWTDQCDQLTGRIIGYETHPAPGLYGSIQCIFVGRDNNHGSNKLKLTYHYSARVGERTIRDLVYNLAAAKQGVYNSLWLLSSIARRDTSDQSST